MRFLLAILMCVVLMIGYSSSFPVEEREQTSCSSQSNSISKSSSSSSSFVSNIFDFAGLTDRFKLWSTNENTQPSQAINESTQISEKNEKTTESYMQSNSQLESQKCNTQSSASAKSGDGTLVTGNGEEITTAQLAVTEETSKTEKRKIKSALSQEENNCNKCKDDETAEFKTAKTELVSNSSSKDTELKAVETMGQDKDTVDKSRSTTTVQQSAENERVREKIFQNQTDGTFQAKGDDATTLNLSDAENTGIFESISQSVSSLISESSSGSTQSQTIIDQGKDTVDIPESIAILDKSTTNGKKKKKTIQNQTENISQVGGDEVTTLSQAGNCENTGLLESVSQSVSSLMSESSSSNTQSQAIIDKDKDTVDISESTATLDKSTINGKKKKKTIQNQIENISQVGGDEVTTLSQAGSAGNTGIFDLVSQSVSSLISESSSSNTQSQAIIDTGKDTVDIPESIATLDKSITNGKKREKTVQDQIENISQVGADEATILSQAGSAGNTGIFDLVSQSVSNLMSENSSGSAISQIINVSENTQGGGVTVDKNLLSDEERKTKSAQARTNISNTPGTEVIETENTNTLESIIQSISSAVDTSTSSNSQSQINIIDNPQEQNKIAAIESVSNAEGSVGGRKKKSKSSKGQSDNISQAREINTIESGTNFQIQANDANITNGDQAPTAIVQTTDSNNISNVISENQEKKSKKKASQFQSESATEIENITQKASSSQTENKSESFFSSVVSDASNAILGSEISSNNEKSVGESNSSNTKSQDESSVVSKTEGIVESVTETVTTITSSIVSSNATESTAMQSESVSSKDTDGVQALSVSKTNA